LEREKGGLSSTGGFSLCSKGATQEMKEGGLEGKKNSSYRGLLRKGGGLLRESFFLTRSGDRRIAFQEKKTSFCVARNAGSSLRKWDGRLRI